MNQRHTDGGVIEGRAKALFALSQLLRGQLAVRDIQLHCLPVEWPAGVVPDERAFVNNPDQSPISGELPVLHAEGPTREISARNLGKYQLHIVRVHSLQPEGWIRGVLSRGITEDLLDLWADVKGGARLVVGVERNDGRELLDQRAELGFCLVQRRLHFRGGTRCLLT